MQTVLSIKLILIPVLSAPRYLRATQDADFGPCGPKQPESYLTGLAQPGSLEGHELSLIFEQQGVTPGPCPTSQRQAALLEPQACQEAELLAMTGPWRGEAVSGQPAAPRRSVLFALLCISTKALGKKAFFRSYCSLGRK